MLGNVTKNHFGCLKTLNDASIMFVQSMMEILKLFYPVEVCFLACGASVSLK